MKATLGRSLTATQARCIGDVNKLHDKEKAEERLYFTKNDEQLLKNLIKKLHKQTEIVEPTATQTQLCRE